MTAEAYSRMLKALLPPSAIWRLDEIVAAICLANGDELARVDARGDVLLSEIDPASSDELLPDFERMLALTADGSLGERRARVIARLLRRQRFRPVDFQQVLAPLLDLAPEDVQVIERTHAEAIDLDDDREIYRFWVYRNPGLAGTPDLAGAQEMLDLMKPSHTEGTVITSLPPENPMITYSVDFTDAATKTIAAGTSWQPSPGAGTESVGIESTNASLYRAVKGVPVPKGRSVTAARVRVKIDAGNTGAGEVRARIVRNNGDGTFTEWGYVDSAAGAGVKTITITGSALAIGLHQSIQVDVFASHASHIVYNAEVDVT